MRNVGSFILSVFMSIAAFTLSLQAAQAAPALLVESGQLVGANNIGIDGRFFDVRFEDASCVVLFDGCNNAGDDFPFQDASQASLAAQALLEQVFVDNGGNLFDFDPSLTVGCTSTVACSILIPTNISLGILLSNVIALNSSGNSSDAVATLNIRTTDNLANRSDLTFAVFTPSTAGDLPEPSAVALFGAGLLVVVMAGRRRARSRQG